ncbi:MAG: pyrroloquinoline quinone biosynthesis peptide chaperone PqqD [Thiolinea sp.]
MDLNLKPGLPPGYRMQWEEAQDCHVLLYPEGMVQLNDTASVILQKCDGQTSVMDVIRALEQEYGEDDLSADVQDFMQEALERGWVRFG